MDPLFGWAAVALATYLTGRDLLGNGIPASDGTDTLGRGGPVSWLPPPQQLI